MFKKHLLQNNALYTLLKPLFFSLLLASIFIYQPLLGERASSDEMSQVCRNWMTEMVFRTGDWAGDINPQISEVNELRADDGTLLARYYNIEPEGFTGTCAVTLYLGTLVDVYNDPDAVVISSKKILPTTFELSSSDRRLPYYLQYDEFYLAYQVVLEPLSLTSHQVSASGVIETLSIEIKGTRALR